MDQSFHLITAQVQFMVLQEERLALVHIPRHLYPFFLKPILQILFHEVKPLDENGNEISDFEEEVEEPPDDDSTSSTSTTTKKPYQPSFLNISITPVECSVMCPRELAERYFAPLVQQFVASEASPMTITKDDFIAMQVYGEGLEAGRRVLELTIPLAMAGISIFFVSTYFSDYILVPSRVKTQVIQTLEKRGFQFETSTDTFASPNSHHAQFNRCFSPDRSTTSSLASPPSTPPPSTLDELQSRTFSSLRKNRVVPGVDRSLRLVQCAAHRRYTSTASSISILRDALTTTLIVDEPRFLSLTLAAADPAASLLLEQRLLTRFFPSSFGSNDDGSGAEDETGLLLGAKEDVLIPIMLDLRNLPLEATGIVCGVAGRLAEATHEDLLDQPPQPAAAEAAAAAAAAGTSIATLPSPSSSSTAQSSSLDSYSYMKAVFSSSAGSSTSSDNTSRNKIYPPLPPSTHRLQPDYDAKADTPVEIGFLSTARAGTILVGEHELDRAVLALEAEADRDGGKSDIANDDETEENVDVNDDYDNDDDDDDMV